MSHVLSCVEPALSNYKTLSRQNKWLSSLSTWLLRHFCHFGSQEDSCLRSIAQKKSLLYIDNNDYNKSIYNRFGLLSYSLLCIKTFLVTLLKLRCKSSRIHTESSCAYAHIHSIFVHLGTTSIADLDSWKQVSHIFYLQFLYQMFPNKYMTYCTRVYRQIHNINKFLL